MELVIENDAGTEEQFDAVSILYVGEQNGRTLLNVRIEGGDVRRVEAHQIRSITE